MQTYSPVGKRKNDCYVTHRLSVVQRKFDQEFSETKRRPRCLNQFGSAPSGTVKPKKAAGKQAKHLVSPAVLGDSL